MSSRHLPCAPEAEVCVLGAMAMDEDALIHGLDRLTSKDFTVGRYQMAFETVEDMYRRGEPVEPATLIDALAGTGKLTRDEAIGLSVELMDSVVTAANIRHHISIVRDRSTRRNLHTAAIQIAQEAVSPELPELARLLDQAERRVFDVGAGIDTDGPVSVRGLVYPAIETIEKGGPKGLPTGFADIDRKLKGHGTHPGQFVVVAGRPGMGKSVFGTQLALHSAIDQQVPTAVFSLEMTKEELMLRSLSAEAIVPLENMLDGNVPADLLPRIATAAHRIHPAPLWIDDSAGQTLLQIRAKARRLKAEHDIGLIVIDYLQYVVADAENRVQEVGKVSRGLKALAKELAVPIVAASQLSRAPELRSDKRPVLSDLRETGEIEQDADVVILLYRPEYYHGPTLDGKDIAGHAEANIAKQRNGPTGMVELYFRADSVRFEDRTHWGGPA